MMLNLKKMINKQSIINSTLLKVTVSIFTFIALFLILYGQIYWDKQEIRLKNNLLLESLNIQSNIQSEIEIIESQKYDNSLTVEQKIESISKIIQPKFKDKTFCIGYYDIDLDVLIKNKDSLINIKDDFVEIKKSNGEFNQLNKDEMFCKVPIYYKENAIGFVWLYAKNANMIFNSYYEYNGMLTLLLTLSALIIIILRKDFQKIGLCLDYFCKIIVENKEVDKISILNNKLPELNPVLDKIIYFTDNLKRVNQELESSKLRLTKIMEGISDGFFAVDCDYRFTFVNPETQRIYPDKIALGESLWKVFPQISDSLTESKLQEAMAGRETVHWEAEGFTSSDQFYEYHAYPFEDGLTVFFRNITVLKQQQREFNRLERLNLIGQLAAGISHEIRNPLTTVKGFLQIFGGKPTFEREKPNLDLMISEIDRANEIITGFLSLAKVNADNIRLQSLNEIIHKVFPMLQADAFHNNKEVAIELNELPDILVNENEIRQLILNLVRNGLEVTPEGGKVVIGTFLKADSVVLTIKDQGPGIPPEIQEKIGTPF
ncbi:histidine kinase dimerization/phospho-acceptor domain-containing protein, partial [Desulfosporosinus sp. PR]|uniref:two-component system sensor histidine kinase NtrB n=1 Tax=Candidatus Desulfosporosinus nitrosoreducens TaxID=3401928 RepID=UPI0027FD620D